MSNLSFLEKLETVPKSSLHTLDANKGKRMGGVSSLYISSVNEVADAINAIPKGETRTIEELRASLAKMGKADTACPAKTLKYWKWMANLPKELKIENPKYDIPWWRVLKGGKPSRHMPGGIENQNITKKRACTSPIIYNLNFLNPFSYNDRRQEYCQ